MRSGSVWSVGVSLLPVQVPLLDVSAAEDDAAPAQGRPNRRAWYFGDRVYSGRHRQDRWRWLLRPVGSSSQFQAVWWVSSSSLWLSRPGQGEAAWATLRPQLIHLGSNINGRLLCCKPQIQHHKVDLAQRRLALRQRPKMRRESLPDFSKSFAFVCLHISWRDASVEPT